MQISNQLNKILKFVETLQTDKTKIALFIEDIADF